MPRAATTDQPADRARTIKIMPNESAPDDLCATVFPLRALRPACSEPPGNEAAVICHTPLQPRHPCKS